MSNFLLVLAGSLSGVGGYIIAREENWAEGAVFLLVGIIFAIFGALLEVPCA
jgi:uncharacterized membrane protein YfcA